MKKKKGRMFKYLTALFVFGLTYHFIFRPAMLDWGAPEKIKVVELSGDHFTNNGHHTRAVLINASPAKIWPWISQLGQERGGFYSYTWLENIFLADMHNIYTLKPELQEPRIAGDTIWLANKKNYNGKGYQIIAECIPSQSFVMVSGNDYRRILRGEKAEGTWSIYMHPENTGSTWLIARSSGGATGLGQQFLRYITFEVPHFIMEWRMLRKIKELAEE